MAFPRYEAGHRSLADKKQQIGPNVRMMVPRTTAGRMLRDAVARSPLPRVMDALEQRLRTGPRPLPEYAPAR